MVVGLDFLVWWVCDRGLVVESGGVGGGVGLGRFMIGREVNLVDNEGMVCRLQPPSELGCHTSTTRQRRDGPTHVCTDIFGHLRCWAWTH
jgi:hypothetical protein